jgi:hypothetical protein
MADLLKGTRLGPWVIFRDEDGLRHAVRHSAILSVSDADETGSSTSILMSGNRLALVRRCFEEVFAWVR